MYIKEDGYVESLEGMNLKLLLSKFVYNKIAQVRKKKSIFKKELKKNEMEAPPNIFSTKMINFMNI